MTKPLPPILPDNVRDSSETDASLVLVEKSVLVQEPVPISRTTTTANGTVTPKRRSMSVGDADLKKIVASSSVNHSLPPTPNQRQKPEHSKSEPSADTTLHNILDQFKGELSQLESTPGATLELQDPSTPARQLAYRRRTDEAPPSDRSSQDGATKDGKKVTEDTNATVVPPRTSSLQLPIRSSSGPTTANVSPRPSHTIPSSGLLKPRAGLGTFGNPRDANRLRALHRSTASSSEPSLLPIIDDARMCE